MVERLDLLDAHVKTLLHYAQPRTLQLQPVAVRSLVDRVARSVLDGHAPDVMRCEIGGPDARVLADPVMLQEVFRHLLINAIEAQSGGGRIEIEVAAADTATVAIADVGPGIPPQLHERIFEPFFTTKAVGAGLGLSIVRQLLELHGGDIAIVRSSPSGTTMLVSLPLATAHEWCSNRL
jgi:signal transduction histidine kinase